jgi:hypothetical protein
MISEHSPEFLAQVQYPLLLLLLPPPPGAFLVLVVRACAVPPADRWAGQSDEEAMKGA